MDLILKLYNIYYSNNPYNNTESWFIFDCGYLFIFSKSKSRNNVSKKRTGISLLFLILELEFLITKNNKNLIHKFIKWKNELW